MLARPGLWPSVLAWRPGARCPTRARTTTNRWPPPWPRALAFLFSPPGKRPVRPYRSVAGRCRRLSHPDRGAGSTSGARPSSCRSVRGGRWPLVAFRWSSPYFSWPGMSAEAGGQPVCRVVFRVESGAASSRSSVCFDLKHTLLRAEARGPMVLGGAREGLGGAASGMLSPSLI